VPDCFHATAAPKPAPAVTSDPGPVTVYRIETDAGDGAFEAHMTKADGTEVTVKFDSLAEAKKGLHPAKLFKAKVEKVAAAPVDDLHIAVEAGDSAAAYARFCATPIDAPERAPEFDLWCGVAAVDIGRSGEGVLALERYTLQFPDDPRARLELARAYFYAGDDVRSREEFESVARGKPPAEVQAGIDRYLAALSEREFQTLCKLAAGRSVSEIADELCISVKTVSTYRSRILQKTSFKTNADLTSYALRTGLIQ